MGSGERKRDRDRDRDRERQRLRLRHISIILEFSLCVIDSLSYPASVLKLQTGKSLGVREVAEPDEHNLQHLFLGHG